MKKLIEVALPLEAINVASAREKSIRHGHPSTLHLWWARRPLAACRAVLFSSLVDDPGEYLTDEKTILSERQRLFDLITELVQWENSNNEEVLNKARLEIARSVARNLGVDVPIGKAAVREFLATKAPPVLDPFAGGGSIPLEAQRLGLRAYASDLNPVAVLINKALIEIPPRFANMPPVHPPEADAQQKKRDRQSASSGTMFPSSWKGTAGLAEDVLYYGKWVREEAEKRIGQFYPKIKLPKENGAGEATVIAWLWARTVKCPNPACGAMMPLITTFELSKKEGRRIWVEPIIDKEAKIVDFKVRTGIGDVPKSPKTGRGAKFLCLVCGQNAPGDHIKAEGMADRMDSQLMAVMTDSKNGRVYLSPTIEQTVLAKSVGSSWRPDLKLEPDTRALWCLLYGLDTFDKLFTERQLLALNTFCDLVQEARALVYKDAINTGMPDVKLSLSQNGEGALAYSEAVSIYLAFVVDWSANYWSSLATSGDSFIRATFARQGLPMVWDYAEANPFSESSGNWNSGLHWVVEALEELPSFISGKVVQRDAVTHPLHNKKKIISTDPPYYDNIGYADLSDFFYVWLRRSSGNIYPDLFSTILVPKATELVASTFRSGGDRRQAETFFEEGFVKAFQAMRLEHEADYPLTVFYAFKQAEEDEDLVGLDSSLTSVASTGWEKMLEGLGSAGFAITGTWPVRTERSARSVSIGTNALASSIVLVCRPRPEDAPRTTRREFLASLKKELPPALRELQQGNIAPVDLAQAAIGPGMAIFSKYREVLEPDGSAMSVRTALALINQALDEYLTEQEGEYDADTRWALAWFEQYGHEAGPYGVAETLSKAKNTGIDGLVRAGILTSRGGHVHLLRRDELPEEWDPRTDERLTAWESVQYLVRALDQGGEQIAAQLLRTLGSNADAARDLAYRLYALCERKGWAQDALGYNMVVVAWQRLADLGARDTTKQDTLL